MTGTTTSRTTDLGWPAIRRSWSSLRRGGFSVRTRITAAVALLVLLALGAAGFLIYVLGLRTIEQTVPADTRQELAELAEFQDRGIDPTTGRGFTSIERLVEEFLLRNVPSTSELMVGVWDGAARRASASARSGLLDDPTFVEALLSRTRSGGSDRITTAWGDVHLEVLPLRGREGRGAFAVASFMADEQQTLAETVRTYAVAAVVALALVTAVAAWQAGRLLAPLRTLRTTADEITVTDLSRRLPVVGNDDLTALTQTFNAMLDRLQQAFRGQRAFLDDAGHELRTPVTILRGHLEVLDPDDPEDVLRTRELLLEEADRMSRLVDDMILLTKADRPGFLQLREVAVDELVDDVADKARGLGDRLWQVESRADVRGVLDPQRITQALVQLCHNAVGVTAAGDTVVLGSSAGPHGAVVLWVRDDGPGVPDEDRRRVFERFARGADAVESGSGLGLSIVAAIARAHGGTVRVEDARPGVVPPGARFVLTLPRRREEAVWPAS
ncbi:MAG: hypothetical protein AVDCRST_MAG72-2172 [uncultured Nocardioidaceae bacterium]|uniref:histidine kinase n=1 Tax=uncultured Nocardioidaceae bacterium TaxID=253824 RepID=A0A6J4MNG6_9ACTN|nr:MAG: hypothetical protein AVDCRST_MAG72-2172 [uncultured Nocardioidaceae bacterium]